MCCTGFRPKNGERDAAIALVSQPPLLAPLERVARVGVILPPGDRERLPRLDPRGQVKALKITVHAPLHDAAELQSIDAFENALDVLRTDVLGVDQYRQVGLGTLRVQVRLHCAWRETPILRIVFPDRGEARHKRMRWMDTMNLMQGMGER